MRGPQPMVPKQPPGSNMAQLSCGLRSTLRFQCGLLFLLASWEAGATSKELQKAGGSPTSDHLSSFAPGLIYSTPSDHTAVHSKQRPLDFPKSAEIQRSKRPCNSTHHSRPTNRPLDDSKSTDHESSGAQYRPPPTSKQNTSNPKNGPIIQDEPSNRLVDSTNIHKRSPTNQHSTSAPKSKTTCRSTTSKTRVTRNTTKSVRPVEKTTTSLNDTVVTSHKTTIAFHNSVNSESNRKTTQATRTSYKATKSPEKSEGAVDHRTTAVSGNLLTRTTTDIQETAREKTTGARATAPERGEQTTSAHEITRVHSTPNRHGRETTRAQETSGAQTTSTEHGRETTRAQETSGAHTMGPDHGEKTTSAHEITRVHSTPNRHGRETTRAQEISGAQTTSTEHGGGTTWAQETTGVHSTPNRHGRETTRAQETSGAHTMGPDHGEKTTSAHEKTTEVSLKSTEHSEETTSTPEKITSLSKNPIVHPKKTTLTTKTTKTLIKSTEKPEKTAAAPVAEATRHTVRVTGGKSITITAPPLHKTEVPHGGSAGALTLATSGRDQSSLTSEASDNKSHPHQASDGLQTGAHAGEQGGQGAFPAWAIVVVVLLAVILLLLFIGLILVSCVTPARRGLSRRTEDSDVRDDDEGPNSYPVYLMEQQTLGMRRIPAPQ